MLFQASRGLTYFERLALGGIYCAVVALVEVPTGVFADRHGRRRSLVAGGAAMVASALLAWRAHDFATFAAAEVLAALAMALCSGPDSAYLFDLLAARGRTADYARCESTASAWHLAGSALAAVGGGLLADVDLGWPCLATAGVALLSTFVAASLVDEGSLGVERRGFTRQIATALGELGRNGRLAWLVGYSAVVFVLVRATIYVYQPYLSERGLGPAEIGALYAGTYVVAALAATRMGALRERFGDTALLWMLLGTLAVSFVGLSAVTSGPWMLALLFVQAVANGVFSPLTKPLLNAEIADSRDRAAVLSVESMARRLAMGMFAPFAGIYGQDHVMLLCGCLGIGGAIILTLTASGSRTR
ncbi:MAG: hypothetical protein NT062_24580, partial [Proteobacteria bacterium]|nr:hypothetical protein [Pseudomonadota bacterium]